jgi:hypothetical protein
MKELIFKDKQKREVCEVEMFLEEYNLVASGAPWTAHEHRDHPDYVIFSHSLNQYRLVELTSVYLHDSSVEKEHRFRHEEPIAIPYDAHKLEAYRNRIVRSVERKCATFRQEFDSQIAILSLYLNDYIAIYLSREELLELAILRFHQVAASGPFNQIAMWGGSRYPPIVYYRVEDRDDYTVNTPRV